MYQTPDEFDDIYSRCEIAPKMIGEKVFLGPVTTDMAEEFAVWLNDDGVSEGIGQGSCVFDVDSEIAYLESRESNGKDRYFAIYDRGDCRLIGECSIKGIDMIHRTATLGIFIGHRSYRNGGRGAETVKMLVDFGFKMLNLNNIDLYVYSFNEKAVACYKSVGFKECGRRHDCFWHDGEYWDKIHMELTEKRWRRVSRQD